MTYYCPACDKPYEGYNALLGHLDKAQKEGDDIHIDVIELEGWNEKIVQAKNENWIGDQVKEETQN